MTKVSAEQVLHDSILRWRILTDLHGFLPDAGGKWSKDGPLRPCHRFLIQEAFAGDLKELLHQAGLPAHDTRLLRARADLFFHAGFVRRARRLLKLCGRIPGESAQAEAKNLALAPLDLETSRRAHLAVEVVGSHGLEFSPGAIADFYENSVLRGRFNIPMHVGIALLIMGGLTAAVALAASSESSQLG